jgi:hypothetical protein
MFQKLMMQVCACRIFQMTISAWLCFHPTSLHPSPSICGRIVLTRVMLQKYIIKLLMSQFNNCEVMCLDYISVFELYFSALGKGLLV